MQALQQTIRQVEVQIVVQENDYDSAIKALHSALIEPENYKDVINQAI